jgi:glycosyltransferase involved in cell wall biosynthesis
MTTSYGIGVENPVRPRIAFIAGTLGQAGAEKQLLYMVHALHDAGADMRLYCLTRGEFYEAQLRALGVVSRSFGGFGKIRFAKVPVRLASLAASLRPFRPHIVQSTHFFCNLYAGMCGRLLGAISIGAMRNDLDHERASCGRWTRASLRLPSGIIANSEAARRGVDQYGVSPGSIVVLNNAIDLADFDAKASAEVSGWSLDGLPVAMAVGRLEPQKRFDRFLTALALARRAAPGVRGVIVGDGQELRCLHRRAEDIGLLPDGVVFLGRRNDVPAVLRKADMLVLSSDHEGCPNVVLEAMAARRPVITTPAGDAAVVVQDGVSGYVVPFDDVEAMASRMVCLAESPELRRALGESGRLRVEEAHGYDGLASRLTSIYTVIAEREGRHDVLAALAGLNTPPARPTGWTETRRRLEDFSAQSHHQRTGR